MAHSIFTTIYESFYNSNCLLSSPMKPTFIITDGWTDHKVKLIFNGTMETGFRQTNRWRLTESK